LTAVAAGGTITAACALGPVAVVFLSMAGCAVGTTDATLAALFCFDNVRHRAADNLDNRENGDPICGVHAYSSVKRLLFLSS